MWDGTGAQGVDVTGVNATAQGIGSSTKVRTLRSRDLSHDVLPHRLASWIASRSSRSLALASSHSRWRSSTVVALVPRP